VIVHHSASSGTATIQTNRLAGGSTITALDYYPATGVFVGLTDNDSAQIAAGGRISSSANTGVFLRYITNGNAYDILQIVAGTALVIGGPFSSPLPAAGGETAALMFAGDQVSARLAGAEIIAAVTTTVLAAGKVGTRAGGANTAGVGVHLDSISAQ
jgi:hypothetical protein